MLLPALYLLYTLRGGGFGLLDLVLAMLFFYVGQRLPDIWLSLRIDARRAEITRALPDALDLIVVCVEAGYGLEAAIAKVMEATKGPLADEFNQMLGEVSLGRVAPRGHARHGRTRRLRRPADLRRRACCRPTRWA